MERLEERTVPTLLFSATQVNDTTNPNIGVGNNTENIAVSTSGNIHVAYGGLSFGSTVRVATSIDRGQTFQPSVLIASVLTNTMAITTQGANEVYVAWTTAANSTFVSVSTDSGATFSAPQTVVTGTPFGNGVSLAVFGTNVYVQSSSGAGGVFTNNTGGIGAYTSTTINPLTYRKLEVDPSNGDLYSMGDLSGVLFTNQSTDSGATFSADTPLTGTLPITSHTQYSTTAISVGPVGKFAYIAGHATEMAKIDLTTGLTTTLVVSSINGPSQGRSLAADALGNLVTSYPFAGNMRYRVSRDFGATFDPFVEITGAGNGNVAINPVYQDVVMAYTIGSTLFINVYQSELAGNSVNVIPTGGTTDATEGGTTDTFTVVLGSAPTADVFVTLTADTQVTASATVLTFTPPTWNVPQTVTLSAVDDGTIEGNHVGVVTFASSSTDTNYNALTISGLTANVTDNDNSGVTVTPSGGTTTLAEGGAADTYTVVLDALPSADVMVTLNTGTQVSAAPTVLTFTTANWNVAQTVTVTAVDDVAIEGAHTGVIAHTVGSADATYNGITVSGLTASITDNDFPIGVNVTESGGATSLAESGGADSYTIVLNSIPTANVVITLNGGTSLSVSSAALTFTPATWNVAQTVTVTAVDDAIAEGTHSAVVSHTATSADTNYNGFAMAGVTATITDNDTSGVSVVPVSLPLAEGGVGATFSVLLTSQPTADVTISLNAGTQVTLNTPAITFTPLNWNVAHTVTVTAIDDPLAEGAHTGVVAFSPVSGDAVYNGSPIGNLTANITDNDFPGMTFSTGSLTLLEGLSQSYTAVLNTPPSANVTVTYNAGSFLAASPGTLVFTPTNWNVPQQVTVTALDDALLQGNHSDTVAYVLTSADAAYGGLTPADLTVNIIDNEGTVIGGTAAADKIVVSTAPDLSTIYVKLNGRTTSYPGTLTQMVINTLGGADDIQILDPRVPIVLLGGTGTDKLLVVGPSSPSAFTLGNGFLDVNSVSVSIFEIENVIASGKAGDDVFTIQETPNYNVEFRGDLGSDQILGADRPNTWKILNPNGGSLNNSIKFTSVENLVGGTSTDGFFFSAGKSLAGTIDGGGGTNKLDYSLYSTAVTVNLQAASATGTRGFQNIDQIAGGRSLADRLVGPDQDNTWNVTDWNMGNVGSVSFQGIENLGGGGLDDTFRLGDRRGLKGRIDGGGGSNMLDFASYLSQAITINLQSRLATNLAGFVNVQQFIGGTGTDTLIGANGTNAWTLTTINSGNVNGTPFAGFENLTGGIKTDAFTINLGAGWSGLLNGAAGSDTLTAPLGGVYVVTGSNAGSLNGRRFLGIERRL